MAFLTELYVLNTLSFIQWITERSKEKIVYRGRPQLAHAFTELLSGQAWVTRPIKNWATPVFVCNYGENHRVKSRLMLHLLPFESVLVAASSCKGLLLWTLLSLQTSRLNWMLSYILSYISYIFSRNPAFEKPFIVCWYCTPMGYNFKKENHC